MSLVLKRMYLGQIQSKKAHVALISAFNMSTASTEAKPHQISKNLSFRPATDSHLDNNERPIVMLYGWLAAKAKHIHKYGDFYLGKGFDVLHIKVLPDQLVWPIKIQDMASRTLEYVSHPVRQKQPILVHGFSVGGYAYGETLVKILDSYNHVGDRIRGQILDSPVDFNGVPYGMSQALTDIPLVQKTLQYSLESYLKLFPNKVMKHYVKSQNTFVQNQLNIPTLLYYSTADKVADPKVIENVIQEWEKRAIPVVKKCFHDTIHVSHFQRHPVQYISMLNTFLQDIGLLGGDQRQEKITVMD